MPLFLRDALSAFLMFALVLALGATSCTSSPVVPLPNGPPVNLQGDTGVTLTQRVSLPSPYAKVTFVYQGRDNFIVRAYYEEMGYDLAVVDTLVNAIGNYRGVVFVASKEPVMFEIIADDGTWEAMIEGVGGMEEVESWEGQGDSVSNFFEPLQDRDWRIVHTGTSNFIVRVFCLHRSKKSPEETVVNAIGEYAETIRIGFDGAPCLWIVNADGEWRIQLEE